MNIMRLQLPAWKVSTLMLVLFGTLFSVASYLQALHFPFVLDDVAYVSENTKLAQLHWSELWRVFVEPYNVLLEFLPLRELSYWIDISLFGLNPAAFRLHNMVLYLLCLPLIYSVTAWMWRYFRPSDIGSAPWAAATVTVLFALHPAFVESVVWISGRKYVLPNLLSMIALWFAVNARREHGLSVPHVLATLMAFSAVMLSKSSYVALAPVIALLWLLFWLDLPKPDRRRTTLFWPLSILSFAVLLLWMFMVSSTGGSEFYFGIETIVRPLAILGWLVRLAVSPENRHFFYPVFGYPYLYGMVALGCVGLSAAIVGLVWMLRKRSLAGFALVVFLLLSIPYLQLVPFASPSMVQDRYLALAAWPVILLIVSALWGLNPVLRTSIFFGIALAWSVQTVERPRDWRSFEEIVDVDLKAYPGHFSPSSYKVVSQLKKGLSIDAGETANGITDSEVRNILIGLINSDHLVRVNAVDTGNPREAVNYLTKLGGILKVTPNQAKWNSPVSLVWETCKDTYLTQWDFLVEHFQDDMSLRYIAALVSLDIGRYKDAAIYLHRAIESLRLPMNVRGAAYFSYGFALVKMGKVGEAEVPLQAALEQTPPDFRSYCMLAEVYRQTGRNAEESRAIKDCSLHGGSSLTQQ